MQIRNVTENIFEVKKKNGFRVYSNDIFSYFILYTQADVFLLNLSIPVLSACFDIVLLINIGRSRLYSLNKYKWFCIAALYFFLGYIAYSRIMYSKHFFFLQMYH